MVQIIQARLVGYPGLHNLIIDARGIVEKIVPYEHQNIMSDSPLIDLQGDWLSLGGVDLQINGGLGFAFPELENPSVLATIGDYLWQQGIDAYLPTIVTCSREQRKRAIQLISDYMAQQPPETAQILGVHLEGPCLNPQKRGAHPLEYLMPLDLATMQEIIGDYGRIIKIITLAPELDPANTVIPYLISLGIKVSLGHSLATSLQAKQAFESGVNLVTHAFNAMPSLHHREPGLLGAALTTEGVYCGLIADGEHVCPTMIDLLLKASNYDQGVFLVSDALAPLGLKDGIYPWDSRQIEIFHGTAKLGDGTLAGTTLPLLEGVTNLVQWKIASLEKSIALATVAPRQALGMSTTIVGNPARLLRWSWQSSQSQLTWKRLQLRDLSSTLA